MAAVLKQWNVYFSSKYPINITINRAIEEPISCTIGTVIVNTYGVNDVFFIIDQKVRAEVIAVFV